MKLRSGNVTGHTLPEVLENEINTLVDKLKTLLIENRAFAHDLLMTIGECPDIDAGRIYIGDMVTEFLTTNNIDATSPQYGIYPIVGSLILLVTGRDSFYFKNTLKPVYYEVIAEKIFSCCDDISQDLANSQTETQILGQDPSE